MQNPAIFTSDHYKQAAVAVAVGIGIRLLVALPVGEHALDKHPRRSSDIDGNLFRSL